MKKIKRIFLAIALCFVTVITLASCSKVSKSYADKINKAHENGNDLTYEDVVKDLGDECIDCTTVKNGMLVAIKGYTKDNYKEKLNAANGDTKFEFITITVVLGKCSYAYYASGTANEVLAAISK